MKLKFYPQEKLKKQVLEIIKRYLDLKDYKVFFFGSRLKNNSSKNVDERADIDLGIEGPKAIPLEILAQIREAIEALPTLYSIDVVDFKRVDKDFEKVAKRTIEIISP